MCQNPTKDNELYQKLEKVIEQKKDLRNPLIEILHKAQGIFGYLPMEVQQFISEKTNIPVNKIFGVVTFYNFFSMKPRGKHIINVCTGTACHVKGAPKLISYVNEILGIELGETTKDGQFTLSGVRCVGACSLAPVIVIGDETYGRVDSMKKVEEIIKAHQ